MGYGDIHATNPGEMGYSIAAIALGISVFAYTAGSVSLLASDMAAGGECHTVLLTARAASCAS